jgi:hypothetical protein
METIKLKTHVGSDGVLKLEVPVSVKDTDLEVVMVMHPSETPVDELGWPVGFFDKTYGSLADDPIERPPQGQYETRDEVL